MTTFDRPLLVAGALLFLFGLLQGAAIDLFVNPRMALSAHLTAVQSGTAVMVVGAIWSAVSLSLRIAAVSRWSIILGMFGLWTGLTLAAATGASAALPMAGEGYEAEPMIETLVSAMVLGSSGLTILGWLLLVAGLVNSRS